jgi:alkylation response protein AidB-like acyl-CoA dehydrogenase
MRTDTARFLTWKAAIAYDNGHGLCLEAKIYCSDLAVKSVVDAMSALGVYNMT